MNVLIIEDEPELVKVLRSYLEQAGFTVLGAGRGDTGLSIYEHKRPDLVILDLKNFPQLAKSLGKKATFHFRQKIYQALLNAIRKMDIVARIEENRFALVLFKANLEQAQCVYQRAKTLLDEISLPNEAIQLQGGFRPYEASFGVDSDEFLSTACSQVFSSLDTPLFQAPHKKETPNKSGSAPKETVAVSTERNNAKK